jgi:hypothetical protein
MPSSPTATPPDPGVAVDVPAALVRPDAGRGSRCVLKDDGGYASSNWGGPPGGHSTSSMR